MYSTLNATIVVCRLAELNSAPPPPPPPPQPTTDFLPYGEFDGDSVASSEGDYFGPIILDTPIVMFQKNETELYVSCSCSKLAPKVCRVCTNVQASFGYYCNLDFGV